MVNWNLQPEPTEVEEIPEGEAAPAEESTPVEEAPAFDSSEVLERLSKLEQANKQAESIASDLRRSVGRVQSLVERIEKSSGEARVKLESQLEERYGEMTALLGETVNNIDPAILPDAVRQRVSNVQQTAQQRRAQAELERMIAERTQPQQQVANGIPPEWLAWEQVANKKLADAGVDADSIDWNYANYLLVLNRMGEADAYIESQIESKVPTNVAEKKATVSPTPSAASAAAASQAWYDKLNDPKIPLEEKIKIMRDQKLL